MSKTSDGLTQQQEKFCLEFLKTGNASESYRRAYPTSLKWKEKSVWEKSSTLMANAKVKSRINDLRSKAEENAVMSAQETLREASRLGRFDIRKLYAPDGSPIPIHELDEDTARCIMAVDIHEEYMGQGEDRVFVGYTKKYKVADKNAALDKLFRHHGLYEKDNMQRGDLLAGLPAPIVAMILSRLRELRDQRNEPRLVGSSST